MEFNILVEVIKIHLDKYFNTVYYRSIFISQSNKDICTSNNSIDYPDNGLVTLPMSKSIPL